jgi:dihydroneopterin aldolase
MDRIELRGLRVMARCGVLPEELERPQPFELDVDLHVDLTAAGESDELSDTVDYGRICDQVVQLVTERHHGLMEHVAERVAAGVLTEERVSAVDVSIRKLRPPVAHDLRSSGVSIHRTSRAAGSAAVAV